MRRVTTRGLLAQLGTIGDDVRRAAGKTAAFAEAYERGIRRRRRPGVQALDDDALEPAAAEAGLQALAIAAMLLTAPWASGQARGRLDMIRSLAGEHGRQATAEALGQMIVDECQWLARGLGPLGQPR